MIVFFVLGKSIWLSNSCVRYAKTDGQILQKIYYISSLAQLIMLFCYFSKNKAVFICARNMDVGD